MEKKSLGRGLEDISDIFISKSQESKEKKVTYGPSSADLNKAPSPYQAEDQCEVEETVTFRRKIAFQNDGNAQENLRSALARHLEEGYGIRRIELKRSEDISAPRSRLRKEEEVTIFIKPSLST